MDFVRWGSTCGNLDSYFVYLLQCHHVESLQAAFIGQNKGDKKMYRKKLSNPLLTLSVLSILIILTFSLPPSSFTNLERGLQNVNGPESHIKTYGSSLPMRFEKNEGQADKQVDFLCRAASHAVLLSPDGMKVVLPAVRWIQVQLVGADATATAEGIDQMVTKSNYFIGNDPGKWKVDIPNYARVKYSRVYPGIDLEYYGKEGEVEYDFIIAPGSDPGIISLQFEGMESFRMNEQRELILQTDRSEMTMKEPFAYQDWDGIRKRVAATYAFPGENQVGFRVGDYDPTLPLVIDPALAYSTYLGGTGSDGGRAIAVDSLGNTFITGDAQWGFPVADSFVQVTNAGVNDVFVAKLNAEGTALLYATYIGGSPDGSGLGGDDTGLGIAIDPEGNAYVTGVTYSDDFPLQNAMQTTYRGEDILYADAFVVKLNPTGTRLIYSTYLGGDEDEAGYDIQADRSGHAYVVGETSSDNFPVKNAYQSTLHGMEDVFVSKIKPDGSDFVFSTYLGGTYGDRGRGIAIDREENIYVTGRTYSDDFKTVYAYQEAILYTGPDAFVTKMNPQGTDLIFSTYLTGPGSDPNYNHGDEGTSIAVDTFGYVYVAGATQSPDFPAVHAVQPDNGGPYDGFVAKFKPDGKSLVYSTYLGGSNHEGGLDIDCDFNGNAYIAGYTQSSDFKPENAIQSSMKGSSDVFVVKIDSAGNKLLFSTFLGGSAWEGNFGMEDRQGIAVDHNGLVYVTSRTSSTDFPLEQAMQKIQGGSGDAFVTKIDIDPKITWTNITGKYSLPEGIRVFEGTRSSPKLKVFYMDADLNRPELSVRPYMQGSKTSVEDFNQTVDAYASVNGGFFWKDNIKSAVIYPNEVKAKNLASVYRNHISFPVIRGFFGLKTDRFLSVDWIYHSGNGPSDIYTFTQPLSYSRDDPNPKPAPQPDDGVAYGNLLTGIGGGPVLVKDNAIRVTYDEEVFWGESGVGYNNMDPRTAVGYTTDKHVIMLVADGRSEISEGVGLPELAKIMSDLGCVEALNLDGGGSSQMAIGDAFVNKPSDPVPREVPAILSIVHSDAVNNSATPDWVMYRYTDSDDTEKEGAWTESTDPGVYGSSNALVIPAGEGMNHIQYHLGLTQEADCEVYAWWVAAADRCEDTPYIIYHKNGTDTVRVDQTGYGSFWNILGNYTFSGTSSDLVKITDGGTTGGMICADAIRIVSYEDVTGMSGPNVRPMADFTLTQNYPNPFSQETEVSYRLSATTDVNIVVIDLQGKQIRTLVSQKQNAGDFSVTWDGRDMMGEQVSGGVYFIRMEAGGFRDVKQMVLTR